MKALRIDIAGIVPDFETNIYQYDITVPSDKKDIEVLAIAENQNAQINIIGNMRIKTRAK